MAYRFLIVGSGFSGCVLAQQLVSKLDCHINIWDQRSHIGGNCHTERDAATGIMVHQYGPHIFNTDKKEIWDYVNSFGELRSYVHRVKANVGGKIYSLPVNLHTINQFFNKSFSPEEAKAFVETLNDKSINNPANFEEQALRFIGSDLYKAFFYGYTKKQWGCEPSELPASILKRVPLRFNYDDNYHNNTYTGIPVNGYTAIMKKMIDHPAISFLVNKTFVPGQDTNQYDHVFYTGPIDAYFQYSFGRLGYRTVDFEKHYAKGDYQGATQINYCDANIPYTRIVEHKHFTPWEQHDNTIYFIEYSHETFNGDIPYYPKRLDADKKLLKQYRQVAEQETNTSFLGRLATYRYMDMQHVIEEAILFADCFVKNFPLGKRPIFPNNDL